MYIVGRSVAQGRGAGIASALGIGAGGIVHTAAAGIGLSAILAASATAFMVVKLAGAVYLVFLGVQTFRSASPGEPSARELRGTDASSVFRQGLLTNLMNPKVALFFLAFLPQFVTPSSEHRVLAFVVLGTVFVTTGTLWCLFVAWIAAAVSRTLRTSSIAGKVIQRAVGGLIAALGVRLALETR